MLEGLSMQVLSSGGGSKMNVNKRSKMNASKRSKMNVGHLACVAGAILGPFFDERS